MTGFFIWSDKSKGVIMTVVRIYSVSMDVSKGVTQYSYLIETDTFKKKSIRSFQHSSCERVLYHSFLDAVIDAVDCVESISLIKLVSVKELGINKSKHPNGNYDLIKKLQHLLDSSDFKWKEVLKIGKTKEIKVHINNRLIT